VAVACASLVLSAGPARAVLEVYNHGPQLTAGAFALRITNIGVIGNPFRDVGLSFDPSFEFPRGSGNEFLKSAELWVGAVDATGARHVSGGPMLEWRPTLAPEDRVREAYAGAPGTRRFFDDDGDGRIDEEFLDGKDDDGDGEVDEDLGLFATQTLFARYTDDQPEAVAYGYKNGEQHVPLHLDVKQKAFAWNTPGYDGVAGLQFVITNHGSQPLTDVVLGFNADLDASEAGSTGGQLDDHVTRIPYEQLFYDGVSRVPTVFLHPPPTDEVPYFKDCFSTLTGECTAVVDSRQGMGVGGVALVPVWHTLDPLGYLPEQGRVSRSIVAPFIRAPLRLSFHESLFANDLPPGQGGLPIIDTDRYRALMGDYPTVPDTLGTHDYVVLLRCGPFPRLDPGQSVEMDVALVAAGVDSLQEAVNHAIQVQRGGWTNVLPDTNQALWRQWFIGQSGVTGHETCYEPPEGLEFTIDPHCAVKYAPDAVSFMETDAHYQHGTCIWTDMDCDVCTGFDGNETFTLWRDPAGVPTPPHWRVSPGDNRVTVAWDNRSEVYVDAHLANDPNVRFIGYNLYRLDDWHGRLSEIPSPRHFQQIASFGRDTTLGAVPLASVIDSTVDYDRLSYGYRLYPTGHYRWTDTRAVNGFDYVYAVTAVSERTLQVLQGTPISERLESPILATPDSIVTPSITAGATPGRVWVVPNPYRANAPWDRPPVPGDTFARHLDFFGLPRAHSVIKIYTLAGDFVVRIDHDGTGGDGQARWDLISRNGQETASGVYLFTVDSPDGHQVGKFVMLR
jgi:hypothetical protein